MICLYCGDTGSEMLVIRVATKTKHSPHRWQNVGHCCDACEAAGKKTTYEYEEFSATLIESKEIK